MLRPEDLSGQNSHTYEYERTNRQVGIKVIGLTFADSEARVQGGADFHFQRKDNPAQQIRISTPVQSLNHQQLRQILHSEFTGTMGEILVWDSIGKSDGGNDTPEVSSESMLQGHYFFNLDGDGFACDNAVGSQGEGRPMPQLSSTEIAELRIRRIAPGEYERIGGLLFQIEGGMFERV